jgi:hypothetical protein
MMNRRPKEASMELLSKIPGDAGEVKRRLNKVL